MSASREACMAQLLAVLAAENRALDSMDSDTIAALYPEKKRLVDTLSSFECERSSSEEAAGVALRDEAERNRRALERALTIQRRYDRAGAAHRASDEALVLRAQS